MIQRGINFKVLMVVAAGEGEDIWTISFNDIAGSFSLKK